MTDSERPTLQRVGKGDIRQEQSFPHYKVNARMPLRGFHILATAETQASRTNSSRFLKSRGDVSVTPALDNVLNSIHQLINATNMVDTVNGGTYTEQKHELHTTRALGTPPSPHRILFAFTIPTTIIYATTHNNQKKRKTPRNATGEALGRRGGAREGSFNQHALTPPVCTTCVFPTRNSHLKL